MPERLDLPLVFLGLGGVAVLVAAGLAGLAAALRGQAGRRRRLARVGRRRMSGRLDMEEMRLSLARSDEEASALSSLTQLLARVLPPLDRTRLKARLHRADLAWSTGTFVLLSLAAALPLGGLAAFLSGLPLALVTPLALVGGMLAVDGFIGFRGEMLANRFMRQLPDAIDTIIRGIRSGLPVIECIGTAGQESPPPIGPHFRAISERVQLGEPLEAALWQVARVINKPEMDFLAVSISIQIETGGSLAEALGNLADLLRKRQQMKLKIRAISSEAKASAMIIGALPFVMLGLLTMMNPDYVMPLFTDPRGQFMLGLGATSIGVGAFVMWRMTQFEI